jgi:peptidyl-prolyl cis-trans isomerase C
MKVFQFFNPGKTILPGFFLVLISCSTSFKNDLDLGKTVATVNDFQISSEFFEEYYVRTISRLGLQDNPQQRYRQLDELINLALLEQYATEIGLDDSLTYRFKALKEDRALNRKWIQQKVYQHIPEPNEAQKRTAFFRSQKDLYVRQLYFVNENDANAYYKRIQAGEDFIDLANELYGLSPYDSTAGFIGKVTYFDTDPHFAEKAWSLPYNKISEPFRTRQGFYIIRVENAEYSPMITEQQYMEREKKVAYKVKERIFHLEADAFILNYMNKANAQINESNIRKLFNRIVQIPGFKNVGKIIPVAQVDVETSFLVEQDIQPQDPLIEYEYNGEKRVFTAADYIRWLPELPLSEAKKRTIVSVGRALKYQVIAEDARNSNMQTSTAVQFERDFLTFFYKAGRIQDSIKTMPVPEISDDSLRVYYERLRFNELKASYATYWLIPVANFFDAEKLLNKINKKGVKPETIKGYEFYQDKLIDRSNSVEAHLSSLNMPIRSIMNPEEGKFYVFEFIEGRKEYTTFEDQKDKVRKQIERGLNEVNLLKKLRETAKIEIDTTAFNQLMEYYDDIYISEKTLN